MKGTVSRAICASMCFFAFPTYASDLTAESKVTAVTVYADRAAITRSGNVSLPAGSHLVVVNNMPANFDEASLRVQGKAASVVKIGSVDVKRVFMAELAAANEKEKAKALQTKRDEKNILEAELEALRTKAAFIERLATNKTDEDPQPETKSSTIAPEKWANAWNLVQTGMTETRKEIVKKEIAKRALDEEISKLEREYQQVKTSQRERRNVQIHVEAREPTTFDFTVMYQTPGVSWNPIYDARLTTDKSELRLEQYGSVWQRTGEDWKDVELIFSTARPELGTEMPRLSEWYIYPHIQKDEGGAIFSGAKTAMLSRPPRQRLAVNRLVNVEAEEVVEDKAVMQEADAVPEAAQVVTSDYTAEFHVPGRVDLKSGTEPTKFFVGDQTMKAELNVQTTPRLGEQAYLFAKVTNNDKYPVIPGRVAKYRDGSFMGNAPIKTFKPGESMDLSFGVDDRIKVTYQKTKQEQVNPALVVVGDITTERAYRSKIKNLHNAPIHITVYDQYPVAQTPDIKVSLVEKTTTEGFVKDKEDRQGVIQWVSDFKPQEEKIFDIGFMVKYPKGSMAPNF